MPYIRNRRHPFVAEWREIIATPGGNQMLLEGFHLAQEALESNQPIEVLLFTNKTAESELLRMLQSKAKKVYRVENSIFEALSTVKSPQGLALICPRPVWAWDALLKGNTQPMVVLDEIQDPGNAASIVRTAEAAGTSGIVTTPGTAHLYGPKALRGAAGSLFRLPVWQHLPVDVLASRLKHAGFQLAGTLLAHEDKATAYDQLDWRARWAIVLGQEGKGVSDAWRPWLDVHVRIPMEAPVESLNVGAAAAILLYEARRQRKNK